MEAGLDLLLLLKVQSKGLKNDFCFFYFTGHFSVNRVVTPLHFWINDTTHFAHIGYHFNSRLFLPDHTIPPRGAGKIKTKEKVALFDYVQKRAGILKKFAYCTTLTPGRGGHYLFITLYKINRKVPLCVCKQT